MATVSNGNSKRMYSWWWDSHISPKNSKWLQENLTDMDSKVKQMIKLIEEDADSFARRAEMYYKKRPELMKLVEEFYRAYRALAERYDHATGVIRHAHWTMAEAFPNQLPMLFGDEPPVVTSASETDASTPELPPPFRALVDADELQKDAVGVSSSPLHAAKRNGAFTEEPDSVNNRLGLKQLNDLFGSGRGRARRGLNFQDGGEQERNAQSHRNQDLKTRALSESERASKAEAEILALKNALTKLEAEKEASLHQYQQSLERLSNLDSEVSHAQKDSRGLNERANKAEAEVQMLKGPLVKLEFEKESSLLQYQRCLQKIADLENCISCAQKDAGEINERASKAEAETQALKQDHARLEVEKEAALVQYQQCLEMISNLEEKLQSADEDVRKSNEQAEKAEVEVENLKQTISKLIEEKEASALQYQQCLDTIADLKLKLFHAQEEAQRLSCEVEDGAAKLKIAEEKCGLLENSNQTLQSELDNLLQKLGNQSQELTEKQKELGRLWTSVQEERLRFLEAETAFQTLQHLHSQSQEELRSLAEELQTRAHILKDMETHNDVLQEEVQKVKEKNKGLHELNLSSAASIKNLQEEIASLRGTIEKLEAEVELRVDQRNALQQEIYCLKEELNELSKKHQDMIEQVELVGLDPDCFGSSVKELQDENSNLKEAVEREINEKMTRLEKLAIMEKLVERNSVLEKSISDLTAEQEQARGKVKTLEEASQSLLEEKSVLLSEKETLISSLQIAIGNSEKLSVTNKFLENSLFDANAELEGLRIKLKGLEDSCFQLGNEKFGLITERESLISQLDITRQSLENLGKGHAELTMKVLALGTEREASLQKIKELGVSLDAKSQEYARLVQSSQAHMSDMKLEIHHLQAEKQCREKEYQEELDRGIYAQIEIFVLQKSLQDLQENIFSLKAEYHDIREASKLSERIISDLVHENCSQQMRIESLVDRVEKLRLGLQQVLTRLEIVPAFGYEDEKEKDLKIICSILNRLDEMQTMLLEIQEENQHSSIENIVLVVLLQQLKSEAADIAAEKSMLDQEFKIRCQQLLSLQCGTQNLIEMNEQLTSKVKEGCHREEGLKTDVENLHRQVSNLQGAYKHLEEENFRTLDEKRSLTESVLCLEEDNCKLEEDVSFILSEAIYQSKLSLIFKDILLGKLAELSKLSGDLGILHSMKNKLEGKVQDLETKLKDAQTENSQLNESLEKYKTELSSLRSVNVQFTHEIANGKDLLCQKEKELLEAAQMLSLMQNEKTELSNAVDNLSSKHNEFKVQQEEREQHILKLGRDCDDQLKETMCVREAKQKLEAELQQLLQEVEETKLEKEKLSHELLKERNEAELWESQATALFGDLQISAVHEVLLEGNTHELAKTHESLEIKGESKDVKIDQLRDRVSSLDDEKEELKAHVAKYIPAILLLNDSIGSLENCIHYSQKSDDEVIKGTDSVTILNAESHSKACENELSDLQNMHLRIKAIEEAVIEKEMAMKLKNSNANSQLEAAMKQIEDLKSGSRRSKNKQEKKRTFEISREESEMVTKDIMLDQISDCSSYGISRRGTLEIDELWETTGQTSGIDLQLEKPHKPINAQTLDAVKRNKGKTPSEESIIDKLEISGSFADPNPQVNKRKVLERLDSDLKKLSNLQITVQDLKSKIKIDEKGKNSKGDEHETVKGQLERADEAIMELFDVNRKLTTKVENGFSSSEGESAVLDDNGIARRRRISEMARRGSEKIGRLQLEVQRIQFLLLKLDGQRESRANKTKISERNTRVLLMDYIHGGTRSGQKKKTSSRFCACVQPRSP